MSLLIGVLVFYYLEEGGKWKKEGWACKTKLTLKKGKNTVLELGRSDIQGKDISNNNKSNEQDNIDVIDNKINAGDKETMASVDTDKMVLELIESATNRKDVINDNNEDNNAKLHEQDNTNDMGKQSKDDVNETMASATSLI